MQTTIEYLGWTGWFVALFLILGWLGWMMATDRFPTGCGTDGHGNLNASCYAADGHLLKVWEHN